MLLKQAILHDFLCPLNTCPGNNGTRCERDKKIQHARPAKRPALMTSRTRVCQQVNQDINASHPPNRLIKNDRISKHNANPAWPTRVHLSALLLGIRTEHTELAAHLPVVTQLRDMLARLLSDALSVLVHGRQSFLGQLGHLPLRSLCTIQARAQFWIIRLRRVRSCFMRRGNNVLDRISQADWTLIDAQRPASCIGRSDHWIWS